MRNWLLLCEYFFNRFDVATNPGLLFETSEHSIWIDGVMCVPCHQEVGPPTCALIFKLNPKVVFCLTRWNVIPMLLKASYSNNRFIQAFQDPYHHSEGKKKKVSHIFPYTSVSYSFLKIFIYGYVCAFFQGIRYICAGAHRGQQRESGADAEATSDWVIPKVDARKKMHVLQKNNKYSQNIKTFFQPLPLFVI